MRINFLPLHACKYKIGKNKSTIISYLMLAVIGGIFVFFASFSTSPLYPYYYGGDSAQFQTIGRGWAEGMIPYRDFFDHKGPVIFFVDMLGFAISGTSSGIFVIQIILMFITLAALFKTAKLVTHENAYGMAAVVMSLLALTLVYGDGNMTEEYCLPFISLSTYFQLRYFYEGEQCDDKKHDRRAAVLYGFSFGVCFLTRVTNAVTICSGILVIGVLLILKKQYVNLVQNVLCFIGGFFAITLPFVVYFSYYGILSELFYAMLQYNFEYQQHMTSWVIHSTGDTWSRFGLQYFTFYIIFGASLLAVLRRKYALSMYFLICGILESYLFFSGASFSQYAIITIPQLVLVLNEIAALKTFSTAGGSLKIIFLCAIVLFCSNALGRFVKRPANIRNEYKNKPEVGYETLLECIPNEEKDSFVAYGGNDLKTLYLLNDLSPCYKYFVIQEWHASFSEYVKKDIYSTFKNGNALWILTDQSTGNIDDILDTRYQVINSTEKYRLYRLGQPNT